MPLIFIAVKLLLFHTLILNAATNIKEKPPGIFQGASNPPSISYFIFDKLVSVFIISGRDVLPEKITMAY